MEKYNPKNIVKIEVNYKEENNTYKYSSEKRLFGVLITPEGFINGYDISNYPNSAKCVLENNTHCYIEDNKVYYKPNVEIHMSDGRKDCLWFETEGKVKEFIKQEGFFEVNWIEYN
jgi:nitrous oxide reductase accessory protein NosL